jgi:hypothetical protein
MIDKINHKKESLKQSKEKLDKVNTKDDLQQWFIGYSEDIANQRYNYKANENKPQLKGVKSLEIKAKVYEDGKAYEEKEQKAIKVENDRRKMIISCRFIEDKNIDAHGDIKDVKKAAIDLKNFINLCEEELKKIPKDKDSEDHAWLTVKREGDQNSVKATNKEAEKKITKRLEIAETFYALFSKASENTTGKAMNLDEVEAKVITNAISCMNELYVVKKDDNGEEDGYVISTSAHVISTSAHAISTSAHAILKKMDDIKQKIHSNESHKSESSQHEHQKDESRSYHSSDSEGYINNNYYSNQNIKGSVQNTVAKRMADCYKKGGKSKSVSGTRGVV